MRSSWSPRTALAVAGVGSVLLIGGTVFEQTADGAPSKPATAARGAGAVFGMPPENPTLLDNGKLPPASRTGKQGTSDRALSRQGAGDKDRAPKALRLRSRTAHRDATRAGAWKLLRETTGDTLDAQPGPAPELGEVDRVNSPYSVQVKIDPKSSADENAPKRGIFLSSMPIAIPPKDRDPKDKGELADSVLVTHDGHLEQRTPVFGVTLPQTASGLATLDGTGVSVDLVDGDQSGAQATSAETKDEVAWYGEVLPSVDLAVKALPTGFETVHQLRSADATEDIDVPLRVPENAKVRLLTEKEREGGTTDVAAVVERDDKTLVSISSPVAYDADGVTVPVELRATADGLRMHVAHHGADVRYPLTLDPSYTQDYEASGNASLSSNLFSYSTRPNLLTPIAGYAAGAWGLHIGAPQANSGYANGDYAGFTFISQAEPTGPTTLHPQGGYIYQFNAYKLTYGAYPDVPSAAGPYEPLLMAGILNPNATRYENGGGTQAQQIWQNLSANNAVTAGPLVRNQRATSMYASIYTANGSNQSTGVTYDQTWAKTGNAATFRLVKTAAAQYYYGYARLGWYGVLASDRGNPFFVQSPVNPQQWFDRASGTLPVQAHDYGYGVATFTIFDSSSNIRTQQSVCNVGQYAQPCQWDRSATLSTASLSPGKANYYGTVYDGTGYYGQEQWTLRVDDDKPTVAFDPAQLGQTIRPEGPSGSTTGIKINANDGAAGIKTVSVTVDGVAYDVPQPTCTIDNCQKNLQYTIPADKMSDGAHIVKVKVRDQVTGNAASDALHTSDEVTSLVTVFHDPKDPPTTPANGIDLGRKAFGGLGFEDWWTYDTTKTGAGSNLRVNLANGNTTWSTTPVENPGIGLNTSLRLTHNSFDVSGLLPGILDPNNAGIGGYGVAGRGFSAQLGGFTRLNERLEIKGPGGLELAGTVDPNLTTAIILTDGDGTQHTFKRNTAASGVRFIRPDGVELELRLLNASGKRFWAATRADGTTAYFDRNGWLTQVRDRHNNTLVYSYDKDGDGVDDDVPLLDQRPGCGFNAFCSRRVYKVWDARGIDANGNVIDQPAEPTGRAWLLSYDTAGHLTKVVDRKLVGPTQVRRETTLTYDGNRLSKITQAANAPAAQQRAFELGYDPSSPGYLTSIKDPNQKTTTVTYGAKATGPVPLLNNLLTDLGVTADIRKPVKVADRGSSTNASRARWYRFADPASSGEHDTFVQNGRGIVNRVRVDGVGRMIEMVEGTKDPSPLPQTPSGGNPAGPPAATAAPVPRKSTQTWTPDNYVETSANGIRLLGSTNGINGTENTDQAASTKYCWGSLGQLYSQTEQSGLPTSTPAAADTRTSTWSYRLHRGTQTTSSADGTGEKTDTTCTTTPDGAFVYDATRATDREGNATTYGYGPTPNLGDVRTSKENGAGEETFDYNDRGLLTAHTTQVRDGGDGTGPIYGGEKAQVSESWSEFDQNGDAKFHLDERNQSWMTLYDEVGNVTAMGDPRRPTLSLVMSRTEERALRDSATPAADLDSARQTSLAKSADDSAGNVLQPGYVARWVYDALDRQVAAIIPKRSSGAGNPDRFRVTATSYDLNDNVTSTRDATGALSSRTYTPTDQLDTSTSPSAPHHKDEASAAPDADRNPSLEQDSNGTSSTGEVTRYAYDEADNPTTRADPLGALNAAGHRTRWQYDAFDQPEVQIRDGQNPATLISSRQYDARGNVIGESDPKLNETYTTDPRSNAAGTATQNATALGAATQRHLYTYDPFDRVKTDTQNPIGGTRTAGDGVGLLTSFEYDREDRLKSRISPAGRMTKFDYDARGEMVKRYDPFTYDPARTRAERTRDFAETTYNHRLDGQISSIVSPRGGETADTDDFTTRLSYWETGELKRRGLPRASGQYGQDWKVEYTVNEVGDPTSIKDARETTFTNTFLDTGELESTKRPGYWFYDQQQGQIRERTDEDPKPTQTGNGEMPSKPGQGDFGTTDAQDLPDVLPAKGDTTFAYDGELRLTKVTGRDDDGSDLSQDMAYDPTGRLTNRTIPLGASKPNIQLRWQYDRDGNTRAEIDGENQATVYHYDDYDRLTRTTEPENCDPTDTTSCHRPQTTQTLDANDQVKKTVSPIGDDTAAGVDAKGVAETTYDAKSDWPISRTDESGARYDTEYDADQMAVKEYRPRAFSSGATKENFATAYTRDGAGRVTRKVEKVTDNGGSPTSLQTDTIYDRAGNPTKVTSPGAAKSKATESTVADRVQERRYDGRDLPWATTVGTEGESSAHVSVTEYDGNGWLRRTVKAGGTTGTGQTAQASIADDTSAAQPLQTKANRNAEILEYDDDGLMTARNLPWFASTDAATNDGSPTDEDRKRYRQTFTYTKRGLPLEISDVFNDGTGHPATTIGSGDKDQHRTKLAYNRAGWPTQTLELDRKNGTLESDADGEKLVYDYDAQGNQTRWATLRTGAGREVNRSFFPSGQMQWRCGVRNTGTGTTGSEEQIYSYQYDPAGGLTQINDWMHHQVSGQQTAQCRPKAQANGSFIPPRITNVQRDRAGRPLRVNEAWNGGKDTLYNYVAKAPNLIDTVKTNGVVNGTSYDGGTTTTFGYDELDRNTTAVATADSKTRTTAMRWWPSGDRRSMTKPKTTDTSTMSLDERYYDTAGLITERKTSRGSSTSPTVATTTYLHDRDGNRTKDERGGLNASGSDAATPGYVYNARDQLVKWTRSRNGSAPAQTVKDPSKIATYTLDGNGRRIASEETSTSPQSGVKFTTTSMTNNVFEGDRLAKSTQKIETKPTEAGTGGPSAASLTDCYAYNAFGSMTMTKRKTVKPTGNQNPGNAPTPATDCTDGRVEVLNTYDTFERLTATAERKHDDAFEADDDKPLKATQAYCFDALDRRDRRITGLASGDDPGTTEDGTQQFQRARAACTKNQTDSAVQAYDYSYLGLTEQLTRESRSGKVQTYEYAADGTRLGRVKQLTGSSNIEWRAYETDAQGSVVALEKPDNGTVADEDEYRTDPYGEPVSPETGNDGLSTDAKENPFRYQGFYKDQDTGTYDMQARAYRSDIGQFLQQDRFADPQADLTLATDPLTSSRYAFTAGNPATRSEYDGHTATKRDSSWDSFFASQKKHRQTACRSQAECAGRGSVGSTTSSTASPMTTGVTLAGVQGAAAGGGASVEVQQRSLVQSKLGFTGSNFQQGCKLLGSECTDIGRDKTTGGDGFWRTLSNASAGFGDTLSFGLTKKIRQGLGSDDNVDFDSGAYAGGEGAAFVHSAADGAIALRAGSKAIAAGTPKIRALIGGACSFAGGTPVLMADGTLKPIVDVKVGDLVLTTDPKTGKQRKRVVTATWIHQDQLQLLDIDGEIVAVTDNHPFWNAETHAWQAAGLLEPGDRVRSEGGQKLAIRQVSTGGGWSGTAYNLAVRGEHTFHVGRSRALVHNSCKLPRFNGPKPSYTVNPAHVPGRGLRAGKTPLPSDAKEAFLRAVPNDPTTPRTWFGKSKSGAIYRYSTDHQGKAHFSGITGVGDGTKNLTSYARRRLAGE